MENKVNFNVLEVIEKVYLHSRDSHLRPALFEVLDNELYLLSEYLHVDRLTALLFANAFTLWYTEGTFNAVFKYFGMNEFLEVLKHRAQIELLFTRSLLSNKRAKQREINKYDLPQTVINRISQNEAMPLLQEEVREKTFVDVLQEFDVLNDRFTAEQINFCEFYNEMYELVDGHLHFSFLARMKSWKLDDFETYFLLKTIWGAVDRGDNQYCTSVSDTANDYYQTKWMAREIIDTVIDGESRLTVLKLIDLDKARFRNYTCARLSRNVIKLLKETENLELEFLEDESTRLMQYRKIKQKPLFYNPGESSRIETLKNVLADTKFRAMQKKMAQKAMPAGITVLFHGEPGTGKTESVLQLAKMSGRNIFKVDISQTKTMWFGESEKLIKKIFTDYAELKKEEKRCPILLFNEADAVISKRKTSSGSTTADTENAIQNILLEEFESFDGILFATTNLVDNMDAAFERRFLFKVKFEKPAVVNAARIWQSKLTFLSEEESLQLAENFPFSGGEVENIARKSLMHELLEGAAPDFSQVQEFCLAESWKESASTQQIGFRQI